MIESSFFILHISELLKELLRVKLLGVVKSLNCVRKVSIQAEKRDGSALKCTMKKKG